MSLEKPVEKTDIKTSFEDAFSRLELILSEMNSGKTSLEESLLLFEEADGLLRHCSSKINNAERKIETLLKNRNQELELDANGAPLRKEFSPVFDAST